MQEIINIENDYEKLDRFFRDKKKILLVCGKSAQKLSIYRYFESLKEKTGTEIVQFSDYKPNPTYDSCVEGTRLFKKENCDGIVAIAGGSGMDVAKCIKMFATMDEDKEYIDQEIKDNGIPFMAVPTTAGTGSEATRYAIIYYKGEKRSLSDYSCIPEVAVFDHSVLKNLPDYQRKATMLDCLCHAIESYWAVKANDESKIYADKAIRMVFANMDSYLKNEDEGNRGMLQAAYIAGKAINITQTTAGHAMCYKLTSLYGLAHGHAVALCMEKLFDYVIDHTSSSIDPRGEEYLKETLSKIADAMGCKDIREASTKFSDLLRKLEMSRPAAKEEDFAILRSSVNVDRLRNNPVLLSEDDIENLYRILQNH